jgi:hypothetical protein
MAERVGLAPVAKISQKHTFCVCVCYGVKRFCFQSDKRWEPAETQELCVRHFSELGTNARHTGTC